MNADMYKSLQRSWALTRKRRAVDKKGLAVALIFLVAMFVGVRACSGKTTEQVSNALQEQPASSMPSSAVTRILVGCDPACTDG